MGCPSTSNPPFASGYSELLAVAVLWAGPASELQGPIWKHFWGAPGSPFQASWCCTGLLRLSSPIKRVLQKIRGIYIPLPSVGHESWLCQALVRIQMHVFFFLCFMFSPFFCKGLCKLVGWESVISSEVCMLQSVWDDSEVLASTCFRKCNKRQCVLTESSLHEQRLTADTGNIFH